MRVPTKAWVRLAEPDSDLQVQVLHSKILAQAAYLRACISAEVYPFIEDMPGAFAQADLLVCRSGASTVAEITAAGRPAVFVPFPRAADDHQRRNAEASTAQVAKDAEDKTVWPSASSAVRRSQWAAADAWPIKPSPGLFRTRVLGHELFWIG